MATNNEMLIKINADIKDFKQKLESVKKETEDLTDSLGKTATTAGIAFAGLTAVFAGTIAAYAQEEQAQRRTAAVIKATGNAAGVTAASVYDLASSLQEVTTYGDETIVAGENMLLTFKNIGSNVFPRATKAMLDMATAMGTDLQTTAIQLGKALQDPIQGVNALRRVGVQLSDAQKDQIEKFIKLNDLASAQAIILSELESEFGGAAEAAAQGTGQMLQLKNIFSDIAEAVGKELFESIGGFVGQLKEMATAFKENKELVTATANLIKYGTVIAGVTAGIATFALGAIKVSAVVQSIGLAFGPATLAASEFWLAVTGPVGIAVAAVAALAAGFVYLYTKIDEGNEVPKTLGAITDEIKRLKKEREELSSRTGQVGYYDEQIEGIDRELKKLEDLRLARVKAGDADADAGLGILADKKGKDGLDTSLDAAEKAAQSIKDAEQNARDFERKRKDEAASHDRIEAAKKEAEEIAKQKKQLEKELVDAGLSAQAKLEALRDRRIKVAGNDKDLLLKIETDFQEKKFKLEKESNEKLLELRKAQDEYEKKEKEKKIKDLTDAASNPFAAYDKIKNGTDAEKKAAGLGAGVGIANSVVSGKAGAQSLVAAGGAMALDAFAPGLGQAAKPLLDAFTQGPDAVKAMVKEFTDALPDVIEGFIEAIPVFITEFANAVPTIIDKLVSKAPDIIDALVAQAPKMIEALALQSPKIMMVLINHIPDFISAFASGLFELAGQFVQTLLDSINPFSDGGFLGFATGGQPFLKSVPSGFSGDKFPAMLSSGEFIVDYSTTNKLKDFLNGGGSSGTPDLTHGLLNQILNTLQNPQTVQSTIQLNNKAFADIILQLNRMNARLT